MKCRRRFVRRTAAYFQMTDGRSHLRMPPCSLTHFGNRWNGLMKWLCLFAHAWTGCRCSRCGKTRLRNHTWLHCRCRHCGFSRQTEHDWRACKCSVCGVERHSWLNGTCTRCGKVCDHDVSSSMDSVHDTVLTAHESARKTCGRCGERLIER